MSQTSQWLRARLARHISELIRLALPLVVARAGILVMSVVDTMMVGRFDPAELNYQALGNAPAGSLVVVINGLLIGSMAFASRAFGAGEPGIGRVWLRSLPYALVVGIVGLAVCQTGGLIFAVTAQTAENTAGAGRVLEILGYALPAVALFVTSTYFLEGIKRPLPGMIMMIAANFANVLLNWVLIYGHWGAPAMGAAGSAWATTAVRWALAVAIIVYVVFQSDARALGLRLSQAGWWRGGQAQRRLGYAAGLSYGLETTAFTAQTIMAGWVGGIAPAAFSIGMTMLALMFMVGLGIASATAVRVGIALGRQDWPDLALAGWTGLGFNTLVTATMGVSLALTAASVAGLFASDAALAAAAAPMLALAAIALVPDTGQVVMASALRARGDGWVPTLCHLTSYYVVMIPAGWYLGIVLERGARGLLEGIVIASVVSVGLLGARFHHLARMDQRSAPPGGRCEPG